MKTLNVLSSSPDWRAERLSNLAPYPFVLDGICCASAEGFIQGIKFPPSSKERPQAFLSSGAAAKRFGKFAGREFVWWDGRAIPYSSEEHRRLIGRAIRAKFDQSDLARRALIATEGLTLVHETGDPEHPDTSLPNEAFCTLLTKIREELLVSERSHVTSTPP
ncbi:MAG: hypothetical protein AAB601_02675 [Patescibacteria group bacterium]